MPGPTRHSLGSASRATGASATGASATGALLANGAPAPGPGYLYDINELADPALLADAPDTSAPPEPPPPPPQAVLDRFGLDLTTLAVLNDTARRAENLLADWFAAQTAAQRDDPHYNLPIKTFDAATKLLWRLTSVRKTLILLSRLPAAAPDPVREKKRLARVLSEAIANMKKHGLLAPPPAKKRPATPGAIKIPRRPALAAPKKPVSPEAQLTPPVPHPPPPAVPPLPSVDVRPLPAIGSPAPPRLCPTLDLSNLTTPTSAFAWSFNTLLQTESLLHRPPAKPASASASESNSQSVSQSPSQSESVSESKICNPQSAICNPKSDPILPILNILVNSPSPSPSPPADDS